MATITRKELIISDEFWIEIIDALLNNILLFDMNKKDFIKEVLKYKNEILILLPDEQTEKYKELILEQDKLIKLQESSQYFEVIEAKEVRREIIQKLKTELGLGCYFLKQ